VSVLLLGGGGSLYAHFITIVLADGLLLSI